MNGIFLAIKSSSQPIFGKMPIWMPVYDWQWSRLATKNPEKMKVGRLRNNSVFLRKTSYSGPISWLSKSFL